MRGIAHREAYCPDFESEESIKILKIRLHKCAVLEYH